jgi:type IV secretory pathway VirB2 component (pilin)
MKLLRNDPIAMSKPYQRLKQRIYLFIGSLMASPFAFAASDTVTTVIYNICDWLSSGPAIGLGILAIMFSGIKMYQGQIAKEELIVKALGISVAIGASYIGKQVILKGIA